LRFGLLPFQNFQNNYCIHIYHDSSRASTTSKASTLWKAQTASPLRLQTSVLGEVLRCQYVMTFGTARTVKEINAIIDAQHQCSARQHGQ
jgi:hypothetical protein